MQFSFQSLLLLDLRLRLSDEALHLVARHYDAFIHHLSGALDEWILQKMLSLFHCWGPKAVFQRGLPHNVLQLDFYVPDSVTRKENEIYRGKKVWQEILTTTHETCLAYFQRVTED